MNITSSGVKGYEYQYKVTVFIVLSIGLSNISSVLIEAKGHEDTFLKITEDLQDIDIEVQVKSEVSGLDIPKLADWLTHFEEGSSDKNLLLRIQNGKGRVVFVTKSRCNDDTVKLKKKLGDITQHSNVAINKSWNNAFVKAVSEYTDSTKGLLSSRQLFCQTQSKAFEDKNHTSEILGRILIWEEVSDEELDRNIRLLLNEKYKIPQSLTASLVPDLIQAVTDGRDKGCNIASAFDRIIHRKQIGAPKVEAKYEVRPEHEKLYLELESKGLLLLTGISLCGKTELAKQLALSFFRKGYHYFITSEIQALSQFLSQNPSEDKIAILDDPWGHIDVTSESLSDLKRVEKLLADLPSNHKLIVTSRREILQAIYSSQKVRNKIAGNPWNDLTVADSKFLSNYWDKLCVQKKLPHTVRDSIHELLTNTSEGEKLQIGQLQYLAGNDFAELVGKSQSELEHIARMNAIEVGMNIKAKHPKAAELIAILALIATTNAGIDKTHLAYILSEEEKLYTLIEKRFWVSGRGLDEEEENYPIYKQQYVLSEEVKNSIEYLERRLLISETENCIYFTHPNYYEAGRSLFFDVSKSGQRRFLSRLERALFCIEPKAALNASSQFKFLNNGIDETHKEQLFDLALKGLNSIYPAVEDRLTIFLIEIMDQLDGDRKQTVISQIASGGAPSSHIFWHEQTIPFIKTHSGNYFSDRFFKLDDAEMLQIENAFESGSLASSYKAWSYLLTIGNSSSRFISQKTLKALLKYEEVLLRQRAAFLFIIRQRTGSIRIEDIFLIFSDEHPSVVFQGVRACFLSWRYFSLDVKAELRLKIKDLFTNRAIAIRANNLMTTFAKDYEGEHIDWYNMNEDEKRELWNLWGSLYPSFVAQLPLNVYLNPGRFGRTMEESLKHLDYGNGLEVLKAWYHRIDYRVRNSGDPDEYEMSVANDLMAFTRNDYESRAWIFKQLVSYPVTDFLLSSLKWIVEYWKDLHETERNQIIDLIRSGREDVRWIKAVLLNSYSNPPSEIQLAILGKEDLFDLAPKNVVSQFPQDVLLDCLHIYFGHPQPFWWLAVHHHNPSFWQKIIRFILHKKLTPFFGLCLRGLLTDGVNGFSSDWADGFRIWKTICRRPGKKIEMAERLIYETATSTCAIEPTRRLWRILIKSFEREGREDELINLLINHIETLQQTGGNDEGDLLKFWGKELLFKKIYPKLNPDSLLLNLIQQIINTPNLEGSILPIIDKLLSVRPNIRFGHTTSVINHLKKKYTLSESVIQLLNSFIDDHEEVGEERLKILKAELLEDITPSNWISSGDLLEID
ncbi:MAG TPA: hypothetical protein VGN63_02985 [Flavisolibacter sp.]|jgi:hypothetical protein|nr:hypothetical protein [Flavisolibacter sp.]